MFKRFLSSLCVIAVSLGAVRPALASVAHAHMPPLKALNMSVAEKLRTATAHCSMPPIAALPHPQPVALSAHPSSAISAPVISSFVADRGARAEFAPEQSPSNRIRAPNAG